MKRLLPLLTLVLLLMVPRPCAASGINLSWGDCGSFGTMMRNFACNTNSGLHTMVASFAPPAGMNQLVGMEGVIDLCSMTPVLPAWWQMASPGTCRPSALSTDFNFVAGPYNCADYWQGQAVGGMSYTMGAAWGFNGARLRVVAAIPSNAVAPTDENTEYYAFRVTIRNDATTGAGSCAGCGSSVCIILNSLLLAQPLGVGDFTLSNPLTNNYLHWQGDVANCPFVVPVKQKSWGQVKALYR